MEKSREQKMTEFYKRKVMRLEEKNDKLSPENIADCEIQNKIPNQINTS